MCAVCVSHTLSVDNLRKVGKTGKDNRKKKNQQEESGREPRSLALRGPHFPPDLHRYRCFPPSREEEKELESNAQHREGFSHICQKRSYSVPPMLIFMYSLGTRIFFHPKGGLRIKQLNILEQPGSSQQAKHINRCQFPV